MNQCIYSIYDSASGLYSRPFFMTTDAAAIRAFTDIANDKNEAVGSHPEDYSLFLLGEWNDVHGKVTNDDNTCLRTALEVKTRSPQADLFDKYEHLTDEERGLLGVETLKGDA